MSHLENIVIPDIGGTTAEVIEILVKVGDKVATDDPLVTLEGDKASMEIPAPQAGSVHSIQTKVGDKVSEGTHIVTLMPASDKAQAVHSEKQEDAKSQKAATPQKDTDLQAAETIAAPVSERESPTIPQDANTASGPSVHASPAVRRMARMLGVDLQAIVPTGEKNRILKEDIETYVKNALARGTAACPSSPAPIPEIDFARFGKTSTKPLNKIKKLTGIHVHKSWVHIPHVTQFGQADITELEAFRTQQKALLAKQGIRLTPLVFMMKALVCALKKYPNFNASLDKTGENLVLKHYFHIGVAVDTPNGLVVPVIRDVDKKSLIELAKELMHISAKARDTGLSPTEMQGGCFSISSLGGIGGTAFTPIVNAPEVAILGLSKSQKQAVYQEDTQSFVPRLILPLSLSYDHRVIDGADGARFITYLASLLADIRTLLL